MKILQLNCCAWDEYSLTWVDSLAGSAPWKSVGLRPLLRRGVRGCMPRLEGRAAQCYIKLALCSKVVQGAVASVSQASQFAQSHQKPMCLLGCGNNGDGIHRGSHRRRIRRGRAPAAGRPCPPRTRHECPGMTAATHEKIVRKDLLAPLREYRSRQQPLLHHCGHLQTLREISGLVAGPLDEDRIGGFERQRALLYQICGILEYVAKDNGHDLAWGSPLVAALDQTSTCRPPKFQRSSLGTRKPRAGTSPTTTTTTTCKSRDREVRARRPKTAKQTETGSRSSRC